jgi:4-diphosphocytidyl-2-C-methyl-D-erythritol kinase
MRDRFAPGRGASIVLRKRIPTGAGLGGGSADAAATLAGLDRLWKLRLPRRKLAALAARLGSDVPFFLSGAAAVGRGRGERLEPVASRLRAWVVILKPPFPIPTGRAYSVLDRMGARRARGPRTPLSAMLKAVRRGSILPPVRNDFTAVSCRMRPAIGRLLGLLEGAGASPAFMTGSGSAIIGVFPSAKQARRAVSRLRRAFRGFLAVVPLRPFRITLKKV